MVRAEQIDKRFASGIEALSQVDLEVPEGDFVSLVGPSGCGKSTLLRLIAGLAEPSSGRLTVDGQPPATARQQRQDLAYVFQDATLLNWRTVAQNVALPLELNRRPRAEHRDQVERVLQMVGLEAFAQAYPNQLSGGMRMRVSIARALVTQPGLLLLDEPFGALDELSRQRLNEELLKLWEADRWTGIFVTHNVFEAVFLSRRVLVMNHRPGRLIADIAIPFASPRSAALRATPEFTRLAGEVAAHLGAPPPPQPDASA